MTKLQWQVRDTTCVGVSRRIYSSCPVFADEFDNDVRAGRDLD